MLTLAVFTICLLACFLLYVLTSKDASVLQSVKTLALHEGRQSKRLDYQLLNLFIFCLSIIAFSLLIRGMNSLGAISNETSIFAVVLIFSVAFTLSSFLRIENIVSKYEKLRFIKLLLLALSGFLFSSLVLVSYARGFTIASIVSSQNTTGLFGLPMWGAIYLVPHLYFWITSIEDFESLNFYSKSNDSARVNLSKWMYKIMVAMMIVFFFFGGDTAYLLLSKVEVSEMGSYVVAVFILLFKFSFVASLFNIYKKKSRSMSLHEFESVLIKRMRIVILYSLALLVYWVLKI